MKIKKTLLIIFIFINMVLLPANAMPPCSHHHQNMPHHERPVNIPHAHHPHNNFCIYTRNAYYPHTMYYDDYFIHPCYSGFKDINLILNFRI